MVHHEERCLEHVLRFGARRKHGRSQILEGAFNLCIKLMYTFLVSTVGKLLGPGRSMKGGLGSASIRLPGGLVVGALAAVNCLGDVTHPDNGAILAGALTEDGKAFADAQSMVRSGLGFGQTGRFENTTLAVVATNVDWTPAQATKVAQMAQSGLARAIRPAHMPFDGDTVFALGTGGNDVDGSRLGLLGALAADVLAQAVVSGILQAQGIRGRPAYRDFEAAQQDDR